MKRSLEFQRETDTGTFRAKRRRPDLGPRTTAMTRPSARHRAHRQLGSYAAKAAAWVSMASSRRRLRVPVAAPAEIVAGTGLRAAPGRGLAELAA